MKTWIMFVILSLYLTSCAPLTRGIPAARMRNKMENLKPQMSKQEVQSLLGKPYKTEFYPPDKEVWFYYTEWQSDGFTTDDEFTPIVFENNAVTGWGWGFDFLRQRKMQDIKQQRIS